MVNKSKKRAFSMVDAVIILTIMAVAVVATTPILTRKSVNYADLGTSASGTSKGAYEVFSKEIVKFDGDEWWEKAIDPSAKSNIILYERKTDSEYKAIKGILPERNTENGRKSTLYEEFSSDVEPIRNDLGEVVQVKFKRTSNSNELTTVSVGGRYIIDYANVQYYKTNEHGVRSSKGETLDKNKRIIEGYLTEKSGKYNDHDLWHIQATATQNFIGEVKAIPWERRYDGNKLTVDRALTGNTATFDPTGVKNVKIHAVGGGGAGGGISSTGRLLTPKSEKPEDIVELKKELALKFKDATSAGNKRVNSPWSIFNWLSWWFPSRQQEDTKSAEYWVNKLVVGGMTTTHDFPYTETHFIKHSNIFSETDNDKNFWDKGTGFSFYNPLAMWTNWMSMFTGKKEDDGGKYISINTHDGTVTVKVDVRQGRYQVFPHQLFDYTYQLGSKSQDSVKYSMPEIFNFNDITEAGYHIAAVGCGSAGKGGTSLQVTMDDPTLDVARRTVYCPGTTKTDDKCTTKCKTNSRNTCEIAQNDSKWSCSRVLSSYATSGTTPTGEEICTAKQLKEVAVVASCSFDCNSKYYDFPAPSVVTGDCNRPATCPTMNQDDASYKEGSCKNKYVAGEGGRQPACAISCTKIDGPMTAKVSCRGPWVKEGTNGGTKSLVSATQGAVGVVQGHAGRSCSMNTGSSRSSSGFMGWWLPEYFMSKTSHNAYSLGGTGGQPHYFFKVKVGEGWAYNQEALNEFNIALKNLDFRDFVETDGNAFQNFIATHSNLATCRNSDGSVNTECVTTRTLSMHPMMGIMPPDAGFFMDKSDQCGASFQPTEKMQGYPQKDDELKTRSFSACAFNQKGVPDPRVFGSPQIPALSQDMNKDFGGIYEWWKHYADNYDENKNVSNTVTNNNNNNTNNNTSNSYANAYCSFMPYMPGCSGGGSSSSSIPSRDSAGYCNAFSYLSSCKDSGTTTPSTGNTTLGQDNMLPAEISPDTSYKPASLDKAQEIEGIWNHIYTWTIPYATNQLAYGESGQVGEYKTTVVSEVTGPFQIELGQGGVWEDNDNWKNSNAFGPNGTDTVVKMKTKAGLQSEVIRAKGGKGGASSQLTDRYQLCYTNGGVCASHTEPGKTIPCCNNDAMSTKDIIATAVKLSIFETKKALVGNSAIIGLGMGRGGEGASTASGRDELDGTSVFGNSSAYGLKWDVANPNKGNSAVIETHTAQALEDVQVENYAIRPSSLNFKGGEGAVIITW